MISFPEKIKINKQLKLVFISLLKTGIALVILKLISMIDLSSIVM